MEKKILLLLMFFFLGIIMSYECMIKDMIAILVHTPNIGEINSIDTLSNVYQKQNLKYLQFPPLT